MCTGLAEQSSLISCLLYTSILETPYIPDPENKKKSYAPYKFEIEMIRKGSFDAQLKEKILQAAK